LGCNAFQPLKHIVICKPENRQSQPLQMLLPLAIVVFSIAMNFPVYFDDQSRICAVEIHDESIDYVLASELEPAPPFAGQNSPQAMFGWSLVGA